MQLLPYGLVTQLITLVMMHTRCMFYITIILHQLYYRPSTVLRDWKLACIISSCFPNLSTIILHVRSLGRESCIISLSLSSVPYLHHRMSDPGSRLFICCSPDHGIERLSISPIHAHLYVLQKTGINCHFRLWDHTLQWLVEHDTYGLNLMFKMLIPALTQFLSSIGNGRTIFILQLYS